jgi:hypothetical protein
MGGGHAAAQLAEALYYMPEIEGSITNGVIEFFNWPNPSSRTVLGRFNLQQI